MLDKLLKKGVGYNDDFINVPKGFFHNNLQKKVKNNKL